MGKTTKTGNMEIKVATYNCHGLPKDREKLLLRPDIIEVIKKNQIICLQETWFSKQDLESLNSLVENYHGFGVSTTDYSKRLISGHPPGGVAIMWHKDIDSLVKPIAMNYNWLLGLEIQLGSRKCILFNVYMPYFCADNEEFYVEKLSEILTELNELDHTCFAVIGDWNANISSDNLSFGSYLTEFCNENNLIMSSKELMELASFTFVSNWGSTSWLDHVVSSLDFHNVINGMRVCYEITHEDHIPVSFSIDCDNIPMLRNEKPPLNKKPKWDKVGDNELDKYRNLCERGLRAINLENDVITCNNVVCSNGEHRQHIEKVYNEVINTLKESGVSAFVSAPARKNFVKPGWNDFVQEFYSAAKDCFNLWKDHGKPRQGPIFELYKVNRARCKYAIRYVKKCEDAIRRNSLARKLRDCTAKEFWKEIRNVNNSKVSLPQTIDNTCGAEGIAELWKKHFQSLFNCLRDTGAIDINYGLNQRVEYNDYCVREHIVSGAIKGLCKNKSCGRDDIYAEHLKYAPKRLSQILSILFSSMISHGYIPTMMLEVVLVPVIKDKTKNINSKDNYRPIALASVVSKVLESILLEKMENYLTTAQNQFGFKKKLGTDQCIYVVKEVIDYFRKRNTTVFTCFLDASKAFDRVNHKVLFESLIKRGVPGYLVRLLVFWYRSQSMCVRWGQTYSDRFYVTNGVRQGGILSPYLFNVYMDELSRRLNKENIGCTIGDVRINHVMYADDLVVLSPSTRGLQVLLKVCEDFGTSHCVKFNANKSAIMCFRADMHKNSHFPSFIFCGDVVKEQSSIKYLGHFLTVDLSDDMDIKRQCKSLYVQGNTILRKFHMCSDEVKLKLFQSYCTPMYTAQLWCNFMKKSVNELLVAYNNILKLFLGLPRSESNSRTCAITNTRSCQSVIRNLIYKFMIRVDNSSNGLVTGILNTSNKWCSNLRNHWRKSLYTIYM